MQRMFESGQSEKYRTERLTERQDIAKSTSQDAKDRRKEEFKKLSGFRLLSAEEKEEYRKKLEEEETERKKRRQEQREREQAEEQ
jgi:hypothetical protein